MIGIGLSFVILIVSVIVQESVALPSHPTEANITYSKNVKRNAGCQESSQCGKDDWCVRNKCSFACNHNVDCESWSKDGYCTVVDHKAVCRFFSVLENDVPEGANKGEGAYCSRTNECASNLICHLNDKCTDPCEKLVRCKTEGNDSPGFLVPKSHIKEKNNPNNYRCAVENHIVKCI